ncbi:branched-chain amino acid transport system II carrier protein [Anaerococcus sp. WCA-380-WT-2B]|uniref:Branched-chain amino acid transport system carrier protein n=1 Tax=Anaerococcus porci TaxID=2652269 RepID=A0A6N7VSI5_9FIRM|nr:branched-chain amino acid transport system II carrier protein [Anaerococcus porci]MSS77033.1 branched-chain amino acid transport system II carrier protein [Anaerococcus porci]
MDIIVIGFALFAMFFGAGNLIFPPMLGYTYGNNWLYAGIGFTIVGVGLTLIAVISVAKSHGNIFSFTSLAGNKLSKVIIFIIALCIGPLGAIPRTAATSSEMLTSSGFNISPLVFSIIFFFISLCLALGESSVVDFIGKFLTPLLLISLFIMIIVGVINPIGEMKDVNMHTGKILSNSMLEGYNTMDALAALAFTPIIVKSIVKKGYKNEILKKTIEASFVAVIGLALVYMSLAYLGASVSKSVDGLSRVELLNFISKEILGSKGRYILLIALILACFTTATGLISSISEIFVKYSNNRLSYKFNACLITLTSLVLSVLGVDSIVEFTGPFLQFAYPLAILLVIFNLYGKNKLDKILVRNSFITVSIVSFIDAIISFISVIEKLLNINFELFDAIQEALSNILKIISINNKDFPWVYPFIIVFILTLIYVNKFNSKTNIDLSK